MKSSSAYGHHAQVMFDFLRHFEDFKEQSVITQIILNPWHD